MSHSHAHGHAHQATERALLGALVLNGAFLLVEGGVGLWTGSLALLSDATHMVSDVAALAIAWGAARMASTAATEARTFGLLRLETLAAFANSLLLLVACVWIVFEGVQRLLTGPPALPGLPVLVVGALGLAINLGSAAWLARGDRDNLNVRGALLHMLADALGSLGALVAGLLVLRGFPAADAWAAFLVAVMVAWGALPLLRDSARVLLQFAPPGTDCERIRMAMEGVPEVEAMHDLHVWSTDGVSPILSAHVQVGAGADPRLVRARLETLLRDAFGVHHTTLQLECDDACLDLRCPLFRGGAAHPRLPHAHDHAHDHA